MPDVKVVQVEKECPPPQREEVASLAVGLGCDCPMLAPEGVDERYLESNVNAWLDDLTESCPSFAARSSFLDCSEFPCMLFVGYRDQAEALKAEARDKMLCNPGDEAPKLQHKGTGEQGSDLYNVFAVRPKEVRGYSRREMVRMMDGI